MSTFATFETPALKNEELLLDALRKLGFGDPVIERGERLQMNGYGRQRRTAQIVIRRENIPGANYGDLGFVRTDRGYELIADDMDIERISGGRFIPEITKAYNEGVVERVRRRVRGGVSAKTVGRTVVRTVRF
jgi:hypothetical protein